MGLRFRKSVKLGKYFRLNFSKSGMSLSGGVKGARVTIGKNGVRQTVGLPGTGLSYSNYTSFKNKKKATANMKRSAAPRIKINKLPDGVIMPYASKKYKYCAYLTLLLLFLGPIGILLMIVALVAIFLASAFNKQHMANVAFRKGTEHFLYGELDQARDLCQQSLNLVDNPMTKILMNDIDKKMNNKISI